MEIRTLYKYVRPNGGITVSLQKPDSEYSIMYRVVASDGMLVTRDGEDKYSVIDTDSPEGWYEVEDDERETDKMLLR